MPLKACHLTSLPSYSEASSWKGLPLPCPALQFSSLYNARCRHIHILEDKRFSNLKPEVLTTKTDVKKAENKPLKEDNYNCRMEKRESLVCQCNIPSTRGSFDVMHVTFMNICIMGTTMITT
jgi:hypothetical protein